MSSSLSKSKMLSICQREVSSGQASCGWMEAAQARACGGDEGRTTSGKDRSYLEALAPRQGDQPATMAGGRGAKDPGTVAGKTEAREGGGEDEERGGSRARLWSGAARTGTPEARAAAVKESGQRGGAGQSLAGWCVVGRGDERSKCVLLFLSLLAVFADGNGKCWLFSTTRMEQARPGKGKPDGAIKFRFLKQPTTCLGWVRYRYIDVNTLRGSETLYQNRGAK